MPVIEDFFNTGTLDPMWKKGEWHSPDLVTLDQGMLRLQCYSRVVEGSPTLHWGSEIELLQTTGYGTYEWIGRVSSTSPTPFGAGVAVSGAVSAYFAMDPESISEIDFEVETVPARKNWMRATTWDFKPVNETTVTVTPYDLESRFVHMRAVWTPTSVEYYLNGNLFATHTTNVPDPANAEPNVSIGHYSFDDVWWGGPATFNVDRYLYCSWFRFTPLGETVGAVPPLPTPSTTGPRMSVQYLPNFKPQFLDQNGNPLSNGKVLTYEAGTTTPLETYSDPEGTTLNLNPVRLDAAGRADIYMIAGRQYKITVTDENDNPQYTVDNITGSGAGGGSGGGVGVNILAYGADPTGTEDSTAAIIAAMEEASAQKTVIYAPAGNYNITSTITNAGTRANCMGIVGDSGTTTNFWGFTLTGDAFVFTDVPGATRFEHFAVWGPGQNAPVTSRGLVFDLVAGANIYCQTMNDVRVYQFPTAGFEWWVPITSSFNNLVTQECGDYGFHIRPKSGVFVGGTSTSWQGCYANNTIGRGYYFLGHGYFAMNGCANDNCNYGYYFENSYCGSFNGMGSEVNTFIDASNPGIGMYIKAGYGFNVKGLWTYNMTNVLSRAIVLDGTGGTTIMNCSGYSDNGINPTYECEVKGFGEGITFIENYPVGNNTAPTFRQAPTWRVNVAEGTGVLIIANGKVSGLNFDTPDEFGNSLYVRNGNVVQQGPAFTGFIAFKDGVNDFPSMSLDSEGTLAFGDGLTAADVFINRSGSGAMTVGGTGTGLGTLNVSGDLNVTGAINGSGAGILFDTPDTFGNSLTVTDGNIVAITPTSGGLFLFKEGFTDWPSASIDNNGAIALGSGTVVSDVSIARGAIGTVQISGTGSAAGSLIVDNAITAGGKLQFNNIAATSQTTISGSNITLTGWDTSTINYVSGGNASGAVGINATGTPTANPVVRVTFQAPVPASYSVIPVVHVTTYQLATLSGYWQLTNQTATYFEVTYVGTPAAGFTYGFNYIVMVL